MTRRRPDDTDYDQRTLANLMATIALLATALGLIWTARRYERWSALERCVFSGRRDCLGASPAPIEPVILSRR
jgi:hypothetical protein